jgi:hypothetical protein
VGVGGKSEDGRKEAREQSDVPVKTMEGCYYANTSRMQEMTGICSDSLCQWFFKTKKTKWHANTDIPLRKNNKGKCMYNVKRVKG